MNKETPFIPLIIIGAARSGTKLLRDLVGLHPDVSKVPYDVNYIWRIGNENLNHDELRPEQSTVQIEEQIRGQLKKYYEKTPVLVEKTVSNCLRVSFTNTVYPDAYYIHLVRNEYDVIESVYRQWTQSPDWRYILKKARTFPVNQAPGYAFSYMKDISRKLFSSTASSPSFSWGPRYEGLDDDLQNKDLLEVCATQWRRCIDLASRDLENIQSMSAVNRVLTIRYEGLVTSPQDHLAQIAEFIGLPSRALNSIQLPKVETSNIGKGLRTLSKERIDIIDNVIGTKSDILSIQS